MIELCPRFTARITCFDIVTGDSAPIVNITVFTPWLNCIQCLQCVQRVLCYYNPIINADLRITSIAKFNPWLNHSHVLWRFRHFYDTGVDMFAYAITIIVNITMYNPWLNCGHILQYV